MVSARALLFLLSRALQGVSAMPYTASSANSTTVRIEARTRKSNGLCAGLVSPTRDNWIAYDTPSWIRSQLQSFRDPNEPGCSDDSCQWSKDNFVDYLADKYANWAAESGMNCNVQQTCTVRLPLIPIVKFPQY